MVAQVDRLRRLLDNLAGLHGQLLGALELNRRPTPLPDWLRHIAAPWRAAAREKGIVWQAEIPDTLPTLLIDADRMAQAVGNLLSNGVKYTAPGGTVQLTAAMQDDECVIIQVRDTGPGISPAEQAHIFTPFYRSNADTRFPQGMGLGLTIAQEIAVAHGGRLAVVSRRDVGSTFTLYLPVDTRNGRAVQAVQARSSSSSSSSSA